MVSRHTRACPLVPPTLSSAAVAAPIAAAAAAATAATTTASRSLVSSRSTDAAASSAARPPLRRPRCSPLTARPGPHYLGPPSLSRPSNHLAAPRRLVRALRNLRSSAPPPLSSSAATSPPAAPPAAAPLAPSRSSRVRVRDIITPFYSRFIGLYQLYEPANERAVVVVVDDHRFLDSGRIVAGPEYGESPYPRKSARVAYRSAAKDRATFLARLLSACLATTTTAVSLFRVQLLSILTLPVVVATLPP